MTKFLNVEEWWKANEKIGWLEFEIPPGKTMAEVLAVIENAPKPTGPDDCANLLVKNNGAPDFIEKMTEYAKTHGYPYRVRPDGSFQFIHGSGFIAKDERYHDHEPTVREAVNNP